MTNIYLASDLHLEFSPKYRLPPPPTTSDNILVLAGDIGYPNKDYYKQFLIDAKAKYGTVLVIAGNHEYYTTQKKQPLPIEHVLTSLKDVAAETGVIFLERDTLQVNGITFVGCTLWSSIPEGSAYLAKQSINDFRNIYVGRGDFISPAQYNLWFERDKDWLEQTLKTLEGPVVVITHHCPSAKAISPFYKNSNINFLFCSNLDYLMERHTNIKAWFCGHTHKPIEETIASTRLVVNPRGYPNENKGEYKPYCLTVEI